MILRADRLIQCHPDLAKVIQSAGEHAPWDIQVLEVLRSLDQQKINVAHGVSQTLRSRHLPSADGLARAADVAPAPGGQVSWSWPLYHQLAAVIKTEAAALGIPVEWGGDWETLKDGPHWQLPWKDYP